MKSQISVVDMTNPNPAKARFLIKGRYRSCDLADVETIDKIPSPLMRESAMHDYFMVKQLGVTVCSKTLGKIGDQSYDYDRVMTPLQTSHLELIISAYWRNEDIFI